MSKFFQGVLLTCLSHSVFALDPFNSVGINSVSITASTASGIQSCTRPKIVGACVHIVCDPICHPEPSVIIQEYLPDLVVTVYPQAGRDPWVEMNATLDVADQISGSTLFSLTNSVPMSDGEASSANDRDDDIQLREVDVIGNPALAVLPSVLFLGIRGQSMPLFPYYQSQLDGVSWRSPTLDLLHPSSWIPFVDEVGTPMVNDWGGVYPRTGFILQSDIAKASGVIAVRGASLATSNNPFNISTNLDAKPCHDFQCKTAGEVTANSNQVEWQRIYPDSQTTCHQSITDQNTVSPRWTQNISDQQGFSWIVWRRYTACMSM